MITLSHTPRTIFLCLYFITLFSLCYYLPPLLLFTLLALSLPCIYFSRYFLRFSIFTSSLFTFILSFLFRVLLVRSFIPLCIRMSYRYTESSSLIYLSVQCVFILLAFLAYAISLLSLLVSFSSSIPLTHIPPTHHFLYLSHTVVRFFSFSSFSSVPTRIHRLLCYSSPWFPSHTLLIHTLLPLLSSPSLTHPPSHSHASPSISFVLSPISPRAFTATLLFFISRSVTPSRALPEATLRPSLRGGITSIHLSFPPSFSRFHFAVRQRQSLPPPTEGMNENRLVEAMIGRARVQEAEGWRAAP